MPPCGAIGSSGSTSCRPSPCTRPSSASSRVGSRATRASTLAPSGRLRRRLEAPPAPVGAHGGDLVGVALEVVGQGFERGRLPEAVAQGLREQPVGEPRVPRQQRPVEVRPDGAAEAAALEAVLAIVAEACYDAAERVCTLVEERPARVVLEARERARESGFQSAL